MPVHIDIPTDHTLRTAVTNIAGWCAVLNCRAAADLHIVVAGVAVPYTLVDRPDVRTHFPLGKVWGFVLLLDLSIHDQAIQNDQTVLDFYVGDEFTESITFRVMPTASTIVHETREAAKRKRHWCLQHLQCPCCNSSGISSTADAIVCEQCGTIFKQGTNALNLLTPEMAKTSCLRPTSNVSSNQYDGIALEVIGKVRKKGGKVLDCGAGLRSENNETVINMEIVDYPSTDIIAVGQSIPFRDGSFDAVFSLAVLEHVSDPFQCAQELERVLKPGGTAYCVVPFLQPEHGYPNHFYNMTRQGIRKLFSQSMIVRDHFVPASGLPIWALHWFLREYSAHLGEEMKGRFNAMTVMEFLAKDPVEWLSEDIVTRLDDEGNWILACTTGLILEKGL